MVMLSAWGKLGAFPHTVQYLSDREVLRDVICGAPLKGLAQGMARSYGDVCLNPDGLLWNTCGLDRYIAFDEQTGLLRCEAGVLLRDIQRLMIPRGWILPVTPGTQLVTLGGAIANDVHGKNHHVLGSFGDQVRQLRLLRTDGELIDCGPDSRPDWFAASVGGLGLTGLIVEATLQLRPVAGPWIEAENVPYGNLNEFFELADGSEAAWEHTVSWIDCMCGGGGRGIFMRGNHAPKMDRPLPASRNLRVPFDPPFSMVNKLSLRPFNTAYFSLQKWRSGRSVVHYEPFFYPLDNILEWNRMYGPRGFFQYQSVVPRESGREAVSAMLRAISRSGEGSFLAVLKTFGHREALGMMSFPRPGVTLALDFPNRGARSHKLFARLDAIVQEAGGRIYLAKDARMPREVFEAGYPRVQEFLQYKDPGFSSGLSRRLMGV
ncbi:MAG: FAD-binding oxidoreductase [Uliginosibacterium sp.]|nr:FAD-binding oxidoreductase [Uliginosibacterium sp.]